MSLDETTSAPTGSAPVGAGESDGAAVEHRSTPTVSRRRLIATAGAVGVAAAAVGAGIGVVATSAAADGARTTAGPAAGDEAGPTQDGSIVVHVRDVASGTLDVFAGTDYRQLRDPDLAARLAKVANA